MYGSRLHSEDRTSAVLDELLQNGLRIVILTVCQSSERTYTNQVTIATHHRNGFQQVFRFVSIHNDTAFCLEFPGTGIHVEHDDIHSHVHRCLLGRESCTQGVVEENHHERLVLAQMLVLITFVLNLLCFGEGLAKIAYILYVDKTFHILMILLVMS